MDIVTDNSIFCDKMWKECFFGLKKMCEYKLSSCPDEVDDVISDVYLALISTVHNKNIPDNPKAWLYSVANNIIKKKYSQLNKQKNQSCSISEQSIDTAKLSVFPDLSDAMISDADIMSMSDKIFSQLSPEEQLLLTYFHYDDKSMKEIAALMNKSESAVKQKHYRLCIKVKKMIKECIENF